MTILAQALTISIGMALPAYLHVIPLLVAIRSSLKTYVILPVLLVNLHIGIARVKLHVQARSEPHL